MLKMFRDRENGLRGGACRDSAQISRHLEKADTETLVDELMELTERAANGDVNLEQIDAYLDALDEKDPLPFKADGKAVKTSQELNEIRDKKAPNEYLKLTVIREGELLDIDVKLGEEVPTTDTQENK